ncbi:tetratricopeptide repeat protein [Luteolibacter marinus]|uniref:tetratricopeptide repeat protein n=1 Tax=Luteolibacter marinus TaxID=2776705 RepID=UPI0018678A9A|nr:tetratricopeptide repeat protein [Luteolibacter marinus]
MKAFCFKFSVFSSGLAMLAGAAEPLPLSTSYWKDPAFQKAFNGSYRIEARIEPTVSSEERGLLVEVQGLMEKGDRKAALAKLKGSALTAKSAALTFNLGNLHFEEGDLDAAVKSYESAIKDYPSFRRAHRNLAMALVRLKKTEEALGHLIEAVRLGDSEGATYGLLGYCRVERGEWASALQAYRMAQVSEPDTAEWKAGVAQCLENLNARDEAVALLDEVIRQRPEVPSYSTLQASILLDLGRSEDAVKALEFPRRLGRLDGDGLLLLAELDLRAERADDAKEVIDEAFALEVKPTTARVLSVTGAAAMLREWDLAEMLVGKAMPAEGEAPRALRLAAARIKIESGKAPEEGAGDLAKLLKEDPTDGEALMALGKYDVSREKFGEAELLFERATAVQETAADAWVELARLRVGATRYEEALKAVDEALKIRPGGSLEAYRASLQKLVDAAG